MLHGHGHGLSFDPTHDGRGHHTCKRKPTLNNESSLRRNPATWPTRLAIQLLSLLYPVPFPLYKTDHPAIAIYPAPQPHPTIVSSPSPSSSSSHTLIPSNARQPQSHIPPLRIPTARDGQEEVCPQHQRRHWRVLKVPTHCRYTTGAATRPTYVCMALPPPSEFLPWPSMEEPPCRGCTRRDGLTQPPHLQAQANGERRIFPAMKSGHVAHSPHRQMLNMEESASERRTTNLTWDETRPRACTYQYESKKSCMRIELFFYRKTKTKRK